MSLKTISWILIHNHYNNSYARLALYSCWSSALTSLLPCGAEPICILGLWDEDALLSSHLLILTPCAWVGHGFSTYTRLQSQRSPSVPVSLDLYVYKTPVSTESECSCVFGCLVWVLYVSSDSILETSPSLRTRPPTALFSLLRHLR